MSWRQVDCKLYFICFLPAFPGCHILRRRTGHINNLYNTTFWALVQRGGMDVTKAEEKLKV